MAARRRYQEQRSLPEEYEGLFQIRRSLQPELRLMMAVMGDAFIRFQRYLAARDKHGRNQFEEVENWFMAEDDQSLYSFETICTILDIEPGCLRKRLMAWKSRAAGGRNGRGHLEKLESLLHSRKGRYL